MNKGCVIKINANARYATNSPGIVLLQEIARKKGEQESRPVPLQLFVVRNDSSCGSTSAPCCPLPWVLAPLIWVTPD